MSKKDETVVQILNLYKAGQDKLLTKREVSGMLALLQEEKGHTDEEWDALKEEAACIFYDHWKVYEPELLDDNLMPIKDENTFKAMAEYEAYQWAQNLNGIAKVDKQGQEYKELYEELLYQEKKLEESTGEVEGTYEAIEWYIDTLRTAMLTLRMKILNSADFGENKTDMFIQVLNDYNAEVEEVKVLGSRHHEPEKTQQLTMSEKYMARLQHATLVGWELELAIDTDNYGEDDYISTTPNLDEYNDASEEAIEQYMPNPQLKFMGMRPKGYMDGGYKQENPSYRLMDNRMHNSYMKEKAEEYAKALIERRAKRHGIAMHGQTLMEGKLKAFIFPATDTLLKQHRARMQKAAEKLDEASYQAALVEMRKTMLRLFFDSQRAGQESYKRDFIKSLKNELKEIRTVFFMPYDRKGLAEAQKNHMEAGKDMKWLPLVCKKDLQLDQMGRLKRTGEMIQRTGTMLAWINKDKLINLYNDGVARLLAMGLEDKDIGARFSGTVFLKTYEEHMLAQGKEKEAAEAIRARGVRDAGVEEEQARQLLNKSTAYSSHMNEEGEFVIRDFADEDMGTPEEYALLFEQE